MTIEQFNSAKQKATEINHLIELKENVLKGHEPLAFGSTRIDQFLLFGRESFSKVLKCIADEIQVSIDMYKKDLEKI
ncbi:MAG: hypothetical protein ACTHLE_04360 [Agriterribacter sp.]